MIEVTITPDDFSLCLHIAAERTTESLRANRKDRLFEKTWDEAHRVHLLGSLGEVAAAKALGLFLSPSLRQFSGMASDLMFGGRKLEVRHRKNLDWDLIVRDNDDPERVYILTRGIPPGRVEVAGWMVGSDAMREEYRKNWGSHGAAYFVPSTALRPIEEMGR